VAKPAFLDQTERASVIAQFRWVLPFTSLFVRFGIELVRDLCISGAFSLTPALSRWERENRPPSGLNTCDWDYRMTLQKN
jgi:hypothetical protein